MLKNVQMTYLFSFFAWEKKLIWRQIYEVFIIIVVKKMLLSLEASNNTSILAKCQKFFCYAALLHAFAELCPVALCIKLYINIVFLYSSSSKLGSTQLECSLSTYLAFPKCTGWGRGQDEDATLFRTTGNVMAGKMLHLNTLNQSTAGVWFLASDCLPSAQKNWYKYFSDGSLHCACVLRRLFFFFSLIYVDA